MQEVDKNSPIPLYFQVKEDIIKSINDEEYADGDALPPETALISMYDVSRTTIRQAVEQLVNEGYLEKRRGKGTFVKKNKSFYWDLVELKSFNDIFKNKKMTTHTELLSIEQTDLDDVTRRVFKDSYDQFFKLERLRFVECQPAEIVTTYVPVPIAPNLDKFDFSNISLFTILRDTYNIDIAHAEKKFTAINCEKSDADLLKVKKNTAVQLVETVTFDRSNQPIEYSIAKDKGLISTFKIAVSKR